MTAGEFKSLKKGDRLCNEDTAQLYRVVEPMAGYEGVFVIRHLASGLETSLNENAAERYIKESA